MTINSDPNNPASQDTNIASTENYTPTIATPNIANPNIANPNIANPNIANPNIANPNIANPNIANPNIANPNIANPNIANPNIANPNIANTDLSDGTITDGTWAITNTGNTSSAYSVNLIGQSPPQGIALQLIVYGTYSTPLVTPASGCTLITESHFVPVANIISPSFATLSQLFQPAANNPTLPGLALKPGETKFVTVRVYDPTTNNPAQALLDYNPITAVTPAVVSQGANTGTTTPPATLTILTKVLPQATLTGVYPTQTLQATGGSGAYTWSLASGTPPTGIMLSCSRRDLRNANRNCRNIVVHSAGQGRRRRYRAAAVDDCRESGAGDFARQFSRGHAERNIFASILGQRGNSSVHVERFRASFLACVRCCLSYS